MIVNTDETKCYWCGYEAEYIIKDIKSKYDYEFAVCDEHCMTDPEVDAETEKHLNAAVG